MKEKSNQPDRTHFQPTSSGETPFCLPAIENQDSDDTITDGKLYISDVVQADRPLRPKKEECRRKGKAKQRLATDSI